MYSTFSTDHTVTCYSGYSGSVSNWTVWFDYDWLYGWPETIGCE